jgi:rhamnogalacturonyl hydrolase YesR
LNLDQHISSLSSFVQGHNFAGYDPYDALNSPIARTLSFNKKYGRIAWIQLLRRLPINLRPLLLIAKGHNPKGLGLFLGGYAKLYRVEPRPEYLERIQYLLGLLETCKSQGYSGNCWGYNFDWQSRAFFIPKYTPTIVNSGFIGHALLDTYEYTGDQRALDLAMPIKDFLLNDLHRTRDGDTFCFSYTPIDTTAVHNANLLGASLLIRLYKMTGETILRDTALQSLAYTMKYQREDSSWYYAETQMQSWIDSFHTGFNLEAVRHFLKAGEAEEYRAGYEKGVKFYADNFFLPDGTPKYYHNKVYPIDIHAPAEAIVFFSGEGECYRELTDRILNWTLNNLYDPKGYFYFRKGPKFTNKIPYMRWGQAWAFHALTEYNLHRGGEREA